MSFISIFPDDVFTVDTHIFINLSWVFPQWVTIFGYSLQTHQLHKSRACNGIPAEAKRTVRDDLITQQKQNKPL